MAMDKAILLTKVEAGLHEVERWVDFNLPLTLGLIKQIIFNDPREKCIIKGRRSDWNDLPASKSLFYSKPDCGLPIGNLTSQLFANIYLNDFDHYVKRDLSIRYYGRYVDDFVLVHYDKSFLISFIPKIADYMKNRIHLTLHPSKIYCQHIEKGVTLAQ